MRTFSPIAVGLVAVALLAATPGAAKAAELDAKAIQILAKTFDFLSRKPGPGAKVVVVVGAADVNAVKAALGTLTVTQGGAADSSGAFAIIVNSMTEAKAARGSNASVITVGPDASCVDSGACLLAIVTQPKVTIYVSRAAAEAAGVEFDPNFKMLITEK